MENTVSRLRILFWLPIVAALVLVILFETEMLVPGAWAAEKTRDYFSAVAMELYTLAAVPLALRLFKFAKVRKRLYEDKEKALLPWGTLRLVMLGGAMLLGVLLYYLFLNVSFGYIAIILLISMVFVYPSLERCVSETTPPEKD